MDNSPCGSPFGSPRGDRFAARSAAGRPRSRAEDVFEHGDGFRPVGRPVWTTAFASRRTSITWPKESQDGVSGSPTAELDSAVTTSSPTVTTSLESIWLLTRTRHPGPKPLRPSPRWWWLADHGGPPDPSPARPWLSGPTSTTRPRPAHLLPRPPRRRRDPVVRATVEDHQTAELSGRLAGADARGRRLEVEPGLHLQEPGQRFVLAADLTSQTS